jgi:1,2-diacylglycerol 3-alpha-glucosyltransferase
MRIGIVTKWFSSGQATVARHLRSAFEELGHESFILARPGAGPRAGALETEDPIWDAPGVTHASRQEVPPDEYARWAADNGLDAAFFDNAYEFEDIRAGLRDNGVATVGRFVWEHFSADDVEPARSAFDVIYSLTRAEHQRYLEMGIEPVAVQWGCHPELFAYAKTRPTANPPGADARAEQPGGVDVVRLVWPGSFMGRRKPLDEALEAFGRVGDPRLRLLLRGQVKRKAGKLDEAARRDPRIEVVLEDQPTAQHLQTFANCDVCLTPSRWEGLGLPLYEATAFGMPIITNDDPPMNEIVEDGLNGLLVRSHADGETRSGLSARTPVVDDLAQAIDRITDDELRARLSDGALAMRERLSWSRTVEDLGKLLDSIP